MATATTQPANRGQSVLNLDTLLERACVTVDKRPYEMRNHDEFSIFELEGLQRLTDRVQAIGKADEDSPETLAQYDELLDQVARKILIAPDGVHKKLRVAHREAIMWAFIKRSLPGRRLTSALAALATPSNSASKSPASRASTRARRRTAG